jgi:hypothetical protein
VRTTINNEFVLVIAIVALGLSLYSNLKRSSVRADQTPSSLRIKTLEIVDDNGVVRMRLGGKLPDAIVGGKPQKRRSPGSGIQLNDSKGDETGGLMMLADGTLTFCFDSPTAEADCMYVMPSGERGFWVGDDKGKDRAQLILKDGKTKIEAFDANGKLTWAAP